MQPLFVSAESRAQLVHEAIKAGAVGFVPKEASSELLIDAIRITSHGSIYLHASVLNEPVSDSPDHKFDEVLSLQAAYPQLTPRQIDVLICTVKGHSNKLIERSRDRSASRTAPSSSTTKPFTASFAWEVAPRPFTCWPVAV